MKKLMPLIFSAVFFLTGCATIVGDKTQTVQVNSNPAGADFIIRDESGKTISSGKTPQNVTLEKSDGSYFGNSSGGAACRRGCTLLWQYGLRSDVCHGRTCDGCT